MNCILFPTPNQGWKIAFGSIGVKKTMKFDGFAEISLKTRIANAQIAAISNRSDSKSRDADLKSRDAEQLRSFWSWALGPASFLIRNYHGFWTWMLGHWTCHLGARPSAKLHSC